MPNVIRNDPKCPTITEMLLQKYQGTGAFLQSTKPYHSVRSLKGDFIARPTATTQGMVIFQPQAITFFDYAIGSVIALSGDPSHRVTKDDTTVRTPMKTNNDDFSIEWVGIASRGIKVDYGANVSSWPDTDAGVIAALNGRMAVYDPLGAIFPIEGTSPAMLEEGIFQKLIQHMTYTLNSDTDRTEDLGTVEQFTGGVGSSFLRANGEPSPQARAEIPEGYLWSREGQGDSQLVATATLQQPVLVPVTLAANPSGAYIAFEHLYVEIVNLLGGLHLRVQSQN